jgi:hypothetical protein
MAEPWDWTEQDLLDLIRNGVEEDLNLDYKANDSLNNTDGKKKEISKDVSAFANSDGGTLVYGMEEDQSTHLPIRLEGINPAATTQEWLEQVINSRIRPRIDGIRINPVPLSAPRTGTAFVVYVPASPRAAHMAADYRHYKRFNFQSIPMEHYELEDVRRRQKGPLLTLEVTVRAIRANHAIVNLLIENRSSTLALYSRVLLNIEGIQVARTSDQWSQPQPYARGVTVQLALSPLNRLPIWEGAPLTLRDALGIAVHDDTAESCIEWIISAPDMTPQSGVVWFRCVNGAISLEQDAAMIEMFNELRNGR